MPEIHKRRLLVLGVLMAVLLGVGSIIVRTEKQAVVSDFSDKTAFLEGSLTLIQGNTIMTKSSLSFQPQVLGSMAEKDLDILASKIIECESNNNPDACNQKYGCDAGMGLFQLIPSTIKYCEEKLGVPIDPFNSEENKLCGNWLLRNEGPKHWGTAETTGIWGSYNCWKDYVKSNE